MVQVVTLRGRVRLATATATATSLLSLAACLPACPLSCLPACPPLLTPPRLPPHGTHFSHKNTGVRFLAGDQPVSVTADQVEEASTYELKISLAQAGEHTSAPQLLYGGGKTGG